MSDDLNMGSAKHREFVDKLINDDGVRSAFSADPVKVLQDHGIKYDPANPPKPGALADAKTLEGRRDDMVKTLDTDNGDDWYTPILNVTKN